MADVLADCMRREVVACREVTNDASSRLTILLSWMSVYPFFWISASMEFGFCF